MPLGWRSNVRLWLRTVLTAPDKLRPLCPRKRPSEQALPNRPLTQPANLTDLSGKRSKSPVRLTLALKTKSAIMRLRSHGLIWPLDYTPFEGGSS